MYVFRSFWLFFSPLGTWREISAEQLAAAPRLVVHTCVVALVPAVSWYLGVTEQGWAISGEQVQRLSPDSALPICVMFYFAMVFGVVFIAYLLNWMAATYEAESDFARALTLVTYAGTPFFGAGIFGLYPVLWLDILVGVAVAIHCTYLLYVGLPIQMRVSPERGFLYASAVVAVALVGFVGVLTASAIVWEYLTPVYVD